MRCQPLAFIVVLLAFPQFIRGDDLAFFEARIRPVLVEHCYSCHGINAKELKGGLLLDSASGVTKGGDSGPTLVPGKPAESLLIEALRYEGLEMPPSGRLPEYVVRDFEKWIRQGAVDPRTNAANVRPAEANSRIDVDAGRDFWAFKPIRTYDTPSVDDRTWPATDIDTFVLAELEKHSMRPAEDTDARTLVRRLYLDLIGLPPTISQVEAFLQDESDSALERLVDELLDSPQFGVRWGRHWLDVARYADSNGNDFNATFHNAWRYRDYVIDAFNQDKPFDQFVREQIAGDLLPYGCDEERAEQIIATGFLMIGTKMLSERDKEKMTMDVVDEQINAVGQTFLGLTLGCARCHDHKFDPIPTTDYYALAGIFRSTRTLRGESQKYVSTWPRRELPAKQEHVDGVRKYETKKGQLTESINAAKKEKDRLTRQLQSKQDDANAEERAQQQSRLQATLAEIERLETEQKQLEAKAPPPLPKAIAVAEADEIGDCSLRVRGAHDNCGPTIPRGFVQVVTREPMPNFSDRESGRRELAEWISSPNNPLTARVLVNRVWHHLMGAGLVRSVDNFGKLGELPSHPKLLDRLAADFIRDGWSIKRLVRRIVLSRIYRSRSDHSDECFQSDPDNRLLWRASRKRVSAEVIRDALLAISGRLDLTRAGSPVEGLGTLVTQNSAAKQKQFKQKQSFRRGAYLPIIRGELPPMLVAFDFADPDMVVGKRNVTNVPAQSLLLMNSPFVMECSEHAAIEVERAAGAGVSRERLVSLAYQRILSREPTVRELRLALDFLSDVEHEETDSDSSLARLIHTLFASTEFRMLN